MRSLPLLLLALSLAASCTKAVDDDEPSAIDPAKQKAAAALAQGAQGGMPDWQKAIAHEARYDAERKAVVVKVQIQPGFHAYTVGESVGKPLRLELAEDSAYVAAGDIVYPEGKAKELPIGRSVIVEGAAEVVAPIQPKPEAHGPAKGTFHYQVCTDEACDRPRSAPFQVDVAG